MYGIMEIVSMLRIWDLINMKLHLQLLITKQFVSISSQKCKLMNYFLNTYIIESLSHNTLRTLLHIILTNYHMYIFN